MVVLISQVSAFTLGSLLRSRLNHGYPWKTEDRVEGERLEAAVRVAYNQVDYARTGLSTLSPHIMVELDVSWWGVEMLCRMMRAKMEAGWVLDAGATLERLREVSLAVAVADSEN